MARSRYEYSTSPRKLEPEYKPQQKQNKKRKLHVVEDLPRQGIKISTEQKKKRTKATLVVIAIFALLLTISYRNSKINEKFTEVQSLKKELSSLQKENEQLKVNIENSLNFNNIEKLAKERLDSVNSNILGVILNKYKTETNSEYYNYYYHSQEEKKKKRKRK